MSDINAVSIKGDNSTARAPVSATNGLAVYLPG